ncbi:MAG: S8 family peptidase [Bacteriovoracaceae bacterium]
MTKLTTGILSIFLVSSISAFATSGRYHPKHLFIKMKEGQQLVQSPLIKSSKMIFSRLYLVKTNDPVALEESLKNLPNVEYVQKDFYAGKSEMPKLERLADLPFKQLPTYTSKFFNDPMISKLWGFTKETGLDVEGAYSSLPQKMPSQVIVAVVDTGVDHNYEDLKDIMWTNTKEIPKDGIDNDRNGYIDDIHGINTLVRDSSGRATMDTMASHWHGTHVSGTIAATQNNSIGIAGVAKNVKIMAIRTVPDDADELDSNIVESFKYAADNGAKIINCSFGKTTNEGGMVVRDTINEIAKKGVLVVASAGNDSMGPYSWHDNDTDPKYPASFDSENLMVVASTTSFGELSDFSNVGKKTVDVASPGSDIYSTIPKNKYGMASGTSMAAPNASGVAALVLGYYPGLNPVALKKVLISSVTKVEEFKDKMVSGGRLNLNNALKKAKKVKN